MKYSLHPEALLDLREAAGFYRDRGGSAIAQTLLAEFEHAANLLLHHPQLGAAWRHGKRRMLLQHFPYSIIYAIVGDEVRILAVAHHRRRSGYWHRRK